MVVQSLQRYYRVKVYFLFAVFLSFCLFSCKSRKAKQIIEEKEMQVISIIGGENYIFYATKVCPVNGLVYELESQIYFLSVSKDSIQAFLPNFDYQRNLDQGVIPQNSYIKFKSYNFDYKLTLQKDDVSTIHIVTKGIESAYDFSMLVTNLGHGTLYVKQGTDKSISFHGEIAILEN